MTTTKKPIKKRTTSRKAKVPPPGSIGAELLKEVDPLPLPDPTVADVPLSFRLLGKLWNANFKKMDEYGSCETSKLRIDLSPTQPVGHLRDTYLHETLHAMDIETQLGMTERQITVLATVLLAWMRDNPHVVAWMLKEQH